MNPHFVQEYAIAWRPLSRACSVETPSSRIHCACPHIGHFRSSLVISLPTRRVYEPVRRRGGLCPTRPLQLRIETRTLGGHHGREAAGLPSGVVLRGRLSNSEDLVGVLDEV